MTEQEKYIERVGLFYEKYGLPKMAGRILGYLISSRTDSNSFEDLIRKLKASKGSISGNVKLLLSQNMIEKHMITGSRQSYYTLATGSLNHIIESKVASISLFKEIIGKGLALDTSDDNQKKRELSSIYSYYEFLEKEIPRLKDKWENMMAAENQNYHQ